MNAITELQAKIATIRKHHTAGIAALTEIRACDVKLGRTDLIERADAELAKLYASQDEMTMSEVNDALSIGAITDTEFYALVDADAWLTELILAQAFLGS